MTRKQKIAQFIKSNPRATYDDWTRFQKEIPEIRLKRVGKGAVLINLNGSSGFIDPESWLHNHEAGMRQKVTQTLEESKGVLEPQEFNEIFEKVGIAESMGKVLCLKDKDGPSIEAIQQELVEQWRYDAHTVSVAIKRLEETEQAVEHGKVHPTVANAIFHIVYEIVTGGAPRPNYTIQMYIESLKCRLDNYSEII